MSWNPFKKAFSGKRTRTEDVEFEREVNKLRQIQAVSKRMYKDMKRCNEVETGFLRSNQRLVIDIKSSVIARQEPLKFVAEVFGAIMVPLHNHSMELRINQNAVFVDPIKKLNGVYKLVEFHAKQREQKLQEYERQQVKLEKHGRKTSSSQLQQQSGNQSKLEQNQRAVTAARTDYERVHERMMLEIPQLLEGRVDYFDLCLFAVIKAQALYYRECSTSLLAGLRNLQGSEPVRTEEEIQRATASHLTDIKLLSIVGSSNAFS